MKKILTILIGFFLLETSENLNTNSIISSDLRSYLLSTIGFNFSKPYPSLFWYFLNFIILSHSSSQSGDFSHFLCEASTFQR
ncbi:MULTISPECIES: DUF1563 domain-containing protein [Leptospira]|uniref:DUF1563 domain-containing protein n=1 Tax=Leptospira TaxID=171 RepID=UPI0002BF3F88|nr:MULTISPECIES: DUF1563 domain-containing protein [Leptospira]EMJ85578.1 PF07599 domain protein [Leptospira kirschneri str. JB]EMK02815.1 PF07599 domain protein [Leptospira kirschneri]KXZ25689.1 hypothetical protein AYB32_03575 [Leptospira kirschneri]KXZ29780.1 hypothetical protein AYB34_03385 [Leptospira sp. ZV016]